MSHSLYRWTAVYFTVYLSRPPHCSLLQLNINMDHRFYYKCIWITLKQTATAITEDGQDTALINTPPPTYPHVEKSSDLHRSHERILTKVGGPDPTDLLLATPLAASTRLVLVAQ